MATEIKHKPTLQKSPNYPFMGLEIAIDKARLLYEKDGKAGAPRVVALKYWGYNNPRSGSAGRTVSALKKFGLTEDKGGRIVPSQSTIDLLVYPKESDKYKQAIRSCSLKPKIYRDLWEKYKNGLPSNEALRAELIAEQNFNPKQVDAFIDNFRKTLHFAGLLNEYDSESGRELYDQDSLNETMDSMMDDLGSQGNQAAGTHVASNALCAPYEVLQQASTSQPALTKSFPIPLKNQNQAVLSFSKLPVDRSDLDLLKKWIDLLESNLTEQKEDPG